VSKLWLEPIPTGMLIPVLNESTGINEIRGLAQDFVWCPQRSGNFILSQSPYFVNPCTIQHSTGIDEIRGLASVGKSHAPFCRYSGLRMVRRTHPTCYSCSLRRNDKPLDFSEQRNDKALVSMTKP
jgi:hypothetical protein